MPDAHHAEGAITQPHESPRIMTVPLWILAFFAAVAGVLALSNDHVSLAHWIDPVFGSNLYDDHLSTGAVWSARHHRRRHRRHRGDGRAHPVDVTGRTAAARGSFLRHSWYINELYDTVIGRPRERLAEFSATVIDTKVIDGGSTGWPPWSAGRAP
jgi:NADH:ubiquinone oxidoreductase subunit 5 (subunit L)/multisubunit Na+/H+ antiporter MnhA subunit